MYHCPTCGAFPVEDAVIERHETILSAKRNTEKAMRDVVLLARRIARTGTILATNHNEPGRREKIAALLSAVRRIADAHGIEFANPLRDEYTEGGTAAPFDLMKHGEPTEGQPIAEHCNLNPPEIKGE